MKKVLIQIIIETNLSCKSRYAVKILNIGFEKHYWLFLKLMLRFLEDPQFQGMMVYAQWGKSFLKEPSYFHRFSCLLMTFFQENSTWNFNKNLMKTQILGNQNPPSEIILPHCGMEILFSFKVTILKVSFFSVIAWIWCF